MNEIIDENNLTPRQMGDLYWVKRIYYILDAREGEDLKEGYVNRDTAEDALSFYNEAHSDKMFFPTGREFQICPPSAAGQAFYAESVASLMHVRDTIDEIASMKDDEIDSFVKEVFSEDMAKGQKLIKTVLSDYLTASGVDEDGNQIKDKAKIKEAKASFAKNRRLYEKTVHNNLAKYGAGIIKGLRKKGKKKGESAPIELGPDTGYEALIDSDPINASFCEDKLSELRGLIDEARSTAAEINTRKGEMLGLLYEIYYDKETSPIQRKIMTEAFFQYRLAIDSRIRGCLSIREACYYYARHILTEEKLDPIICEKIKERLEEEVPALEPETPVSSIPGFSVPKVSSEKYEFNDVSEMIAGAEELTKYLATHTGLFESQCLISVLTGNEGLGETAAKARALDVAIDRFTKGKEAASLEKDQWLLLFNAWVMADAVSKIAFSVMEFIFEYKDSDVGTAAAELESFLPFISYTVLDGKIRQTIRKMALERSGFGVSE